MKKLWFLTLAVFALAACNDEEELNYPEVDYMGTMTVINMENPSERYVWSYQELELAEERDGTLTLFLDDTRFVPHMPELDMIVPGITYAEAGGIYTLLGDRIVPYIGSRPYAGYRIDNLSGTILKRQLTMTFECVGYAVTIVAEQEY